MHKTNIAIRVTSIHPCTRLIYQLRWVKCTFLEVIPYRVQQFSRCKWFKHALCTVYLPFGFGRKLSYKRKLLYRGDKEGELSYRRSKGREIVMGQLVMGCPRRRGQRSVDVDISLFVTPFLITARLC